jgi:uncharacterized protein YndB with AHSA1/START domain
METTATTEVPVYERELQIDASPETVWAFLVDPEKVARWKGLRAMAFDPQPGGAYRIEIVRGRVASGAFVELERPRRLVYTWGWEPGPEGPNLVPPGSSTVEIELEPVDGGTKLRFTHRDLPNVEAAQSHGEGWDHYLPRLATAAQGGNPGRDPWLGEPV